MQDAKIAPLPLIADIYKQAKFEKHTGFVPGLPGPHTAFVPGGCRPRPHRTLTCSSTGAGIVADGQTALNGCPVMKSFIRSAVTSTVMSPPTT